MIGSELLTFPSFETGAARFILDLLHTGLAKSGTFRLGLAGGTTPAAVYTQLAILGTESAWDGVEITFGDERCVPPDHPESNFRMAHETLLEKVRLSPGRIHRIRGEIAPENAADEYQALLRSAALARGETRYRHDLLLLGIGPDGHTASLFPDSPALRETARDVVATMGPKPPPQRVTMTLPLINAARHVCFLVKDRAKQPVIDEIRRGNLALPAAHVQPVNGLLTWLVAS